MNSFHMWRIITHTLIGVVILFQGAAPVVAQNGSPIVEITNQVLFEEIASLKERGTSDPLLLAIDSVDEIERGTLEERQALLSAVALGRDFATNLPNPCTDYYSLNSLTTTLETSDETIVAGDERQFSITISNTNPYPVVDAEVFIKVFSAAGGEMVRSLGQIDQQKVLSDISIPAQSSITKIFNYVTPFSLPSGSYDMVSYVTVADTYYVTGLPFTDDIRGGETQFRVEGQIDGALSFDRTSTFINNIQYQFSALAPQVNSDAPVRIDAMLTNTLDVPLDAVVTWKLYRDSQHVESNLLTVSTQTVSIGSGDRIPVNYTVSDVDHSTYVLQGEVEYLGAASIISVRFSRADVSGVRMNYAGITGFPGEGTESISLFSCVQAIGEEASADRSVELSLTDESGNLVHREIFDEQIQINQTLFTTSFTPNKLYQTLTLTAVLTENGREVIRTSTTYDCADITGGACTPAPGSDIPSIFEALLLPGVLTLLLMFIGLFVYLRFFSKRNSIGDGIEYTTPLVLFIGLLLGGSVMLTPSLVEANVCYTWTLTGNGELRDGSNQQMYPGIVGGDCNTLGESVYHCGTPMPGDNVWCEEILCSLPAKVCTSGTLTGNSCVIPAGQSSCSSTIGWTVTGVTNASIYWVYEGGTFFWRPNGISGTGSSNASLSYSAIPNRFDLYSGPNGSGSLLSSVTVNGVCAADSVWNGSICALVPPPAPTGLTATPQACGTGVIRLTWNSVAGATGYDVSTNGGATWSNVGNVTSHDHTGLAAGSAQSYRVRAWNGAGAGAQSSLVAAIAPSACPVPSGNLSGNNCTIAAGSDRCTSTINWSVTNVSNGSVRIAGTTFAGGINGNGSQAAPWIGFGNSVFTLHSGPDGGGTQLSSLTIIGSCAGGTTWNGSVCQTPPGTSPSLLATPQACDSGVIRLTWNSVAGATGYDVSTNGGATWSNVGNVTSHDHTGLAAGSPQSYRVRAWNGAGAGAPSSLVAAIAPNICPPEMPGPPILTPGTCGGIIDVNYTFPISGPDYEYRYRLTSGGSWVLITGIFGREPIINLVPGAEYEVQIRAVNSAGPSLWSNSGIGNASQICTPPNLRPLPPNISGPTPVQVNTLQTYSFNSDDPEDDQVYYQIDWNGDGIAPYVRAPGTGTVPDSNNVSRLNTFFNTGPTSIWAQACDAGGCSTWATYPVQVNPPPDATALLLVSVNSDTPSPSDRIIDSTDVVRLSWSSTNASTCTGVGFNTGGATENLTGVIISNPAPGSFTNFSITCTGSGLPGNDSVRVTTNALPLPVITLTSSVDGGGFTPGNKVINPGQQVVMQWTTTNAVSCTGINAPGIPAGLPGTNSSIGITEPSPGSNQNYGVRCVNATGNPSEVQFNVRTIAPPAPPSSVTASCPLPGSSLSTAWSSVSDATSYSLRVDNQSNIWNGSCNPATTPGDFCQDGIAGTSRVVPSTPGAFHNVWVHACNSAGCSASATAVSAPVMCIERPNFSTPTVTTSFGSLDVLNGLFNSNTFTFQSVNTGGSNITVNVGYRLEFDIDNNGSFDFTQNGSFANPLPLVPTLGAARATTSVSGGIPFGSHRVRISVDTGGIVDETNEGDNIGEYIINVVPPDPGMSISAQPLQVRNTQTATITWSVTNIYPGMSCRLTGPGLTIDPVSLPTGSTSSNPIDAKSEYVLECTEPITGEVWTRTTAVETQGSIQEICYHYGSCYLFKRLHGVLSCQFLL